MSPDTGVETPTGDIDMTYRICIVERAEGGCKEVPGGTGEGVSTINDSDKKISSTRSFSAGEPRVFRSNCVHYTRHRRPDRVWVPR